MCGSFRDGHRKRISLCDEGVEHEKNNNRKKESCSVLTSLLDFELQVLDQHILAFQLAENRVVVVTIFAKVPKTHRT